jgi:thioredoxin-dependent peroxiredoxin
VEENAAFAQKFQFPFPLLCDTTRRIGLAYGACDTPEAKTAKRISYVIDPMGRILLAYEKVAPAEHPEDVLEAIGEERATV